MQSIATKDLPLAVQKLLRNRRSEVAEHFYQMADAELAELGTIKAGSVWDDNDDHESDMTRLSQTIFVGHPDPDEASLKGRVTALFDDSGFQPRTIPFDMEARINPGLYGRTVGIYLRDEDFNQAEEMAWNTYERLACQSEVVLNVYGLAPLHAQAEAYLKKVVAADASELALSTATTLRALPLGVASDLGLIKVFKQASDYSAKHQKTRYSAAAVNEQAPQPRRF